MLRKLFLFLIPGFITICTVLCQSQVDSAGYLFDKYRDARALGDFARSESLLVQILDGDYQLTPYRQVLVRNALGFVFYETGQFEKALDQYRISERLCEGKDPNLQNVRVTVYNSLALYYNSLGDNTNALEYFGKAHRLLDSIPGREEIYFSKLSMLQFHKGIVLSQLGRDDESLTILKESERIKENHNHAYLGSVYFNLARVYQKLGETERSGQYYLKGIDRWITEYDTGYYELANLYKDYGYFLVEQGDSEEGLGYLEKALHNYITNYGTRHPLTASCYETMGSVYQAHEEYEMALPLLQSALVSISQDFEQIELLATPENESSIHDLTFLSILATKTLALEGAAGDEDSMPGELEFLESALNTNQLSIKVLQRIQDTYLSTESRLFLTSSQKDLFTTGIRLNIKLFGLTGLEDYKEQAFLMAAKGKSNELLMEMSIKEGFYLENLSDPLAMNTLELKQKVNHLSNRIQVISQAMKPDTAQLVSLQDQLFIARDSFRRNMEQLHIQHPEIAGFESLYADFDMDQIREGLFRKETLIEYFISHKDNQGHSQLFAFVVTKKECHFYQGTIDSAFYGHVATVMNSLHGFNPYKETQPRYDSLKVALFGIYRETIQPLESFIKDNTLVIVPDEGLGYVPFDALISRLNPETIRNYAGLPYLLHNYDISYLYNSQLLQQRIQKKRKFPKVTAWIPGYASSVDHEWDNLTGADEEVASILEIVKGSSIRKMLDKSEATRVMLSNEVLHLAMHSLAFEDQGNSPYFILGPEEDSLFSNRLHDFEINALSISSPMVVLSSCESAGGTLQSGEGIMSLSRSFLQAGAASVIHSLWPLEDKKGKEIIVDFYQEIKHGESKSSALSKAKREYLTTNPPSYTHPYYWATFQITGDPSPLVNRWKIPVTALISLILLAGFYFLIRRSFLTRE